MRSIFVLQIANTLAEQAEVETGFGDIEMRIGSIFDGEGITRSPSASATSFLD